MKLRYLVLVLTIGIGMLMLINAGKIQSNSYPMVDVTKINERFHEVVKGLNSGKNIESLEKTYNCEILFKSDPDYQSKLMSGIKNSKILMDYESENTLIAKVIFSGEGDLLNALRLQIRDRMFQVCLCILLAGYILIGCIYYFYIRPFKKMQFFTSNIAKGNLDTPLSIARGDYFGAFSESFDIMREELKRARKSEYEANISKKELVAELSHDMKTPIATIMATCEVLKAKAEKHADMEAERDLLEKISVIEQKADMINELIGNMFHATMEELENLKVEAEEKPSTQIAEMFEEMKYYETIEIKDVVPECLVYMDTLRLKQVIDNIINNSYKYAGTKIEVSFQEQTEGVLVEIRDYGSGLPEEELPFVTEKYFRGKNAKGKSGAGLGLFLAKYFMQNMKGGFECFNDSGFVVRLFLRKV